MLSWSCALVPLGWPHHPPQLALCGPPEVILCGPLQCTLCGSTISPWSGNNKVPLTVEVPYPISLVQMIRCSSPTTTIARQVDQRGLNDWTSNACNPGIAAPSLQVKLGIAVS